MNKLNKLNVCKAITVAAFALFAQGLYADGVFGKPELFDRSDVLAMAMDIEGRYLYGGAGDLVLVFDISDPLKPKKVGEVAGVGSARQLVVQNGICYVTSREYGVWIIDATNPAKPRIRSRFDCCELATGIDVAGDVCFCGQRQNGVEFIDVSDLDHPRHIAMRKTAESQSVVYCDGWLYSGEWMKGEVTIFDAHDMTNIRKTGTIELYGYGDGVWRQGDYLYASRGHNSVHRKVTGGLDLSRESKVDRPASGGGMGHGLDIFDVKNPLTPKRVGTVDFPILYVGGLDMWTPRTSGDLLIAAQTHNGLFAVDISDKTNPKVLDRAVWPCRKPIKGRTDIPSDCVGSVAIGEGAVYVAVRGHGFFVLPCAKARLERMPKGVLPKNASYREPYVSDKAVWHAWKPKDVGQVRAAAVRGDSAYVACGDAGLYRVDILPNGQGWKERGKVEGREQVYDVSICGDRLYTAEGEQGFGVYDITGEMPREIARLPRISKVNHFAFWVEAISDTRLLCSDRHPWCLYDISKLPKFKCLLRDIGSNPGWDKYVMDHAIGGRYMAVNMCHRSVWWFDVVEGKFTVKTDKNFTTLRNGLCAFGADHAIFTRKGGYAVLDPNQGDAEDGSLWPQIELPRYEGKRYQPGVPRSDGRFVAFTSRINRYVSICDLKDPQHPVMCGAWRVKGNPDAATFHNGKAIIPCGYEGLLLQR